MKNNRTLNFELSSLSSDLSTSRMSSNITLKPSIRLGIVPTHLRFVGGLLPDEAGRLPRNEAGELIIVNGVKNLCSISPVALNSIQIPMFSGTDADDFNELIRELKSLDLEIYLVVMVGGADPLNPADEDAVVAQLVAAVHTAIAHKVRHISSTSLEEWMNTGAGDDIKGAIAQTVKLHRRVYQESGIEGSCVENWHMEFLRPGEFTTFTSLEKGWSFIKAMNQDLGKPFFKLLVDAAHCGDSGVPLAENQALITRIAAAGELGVFHASAKTTRGCLSTDDGWIAALLTAAAKTGELRHVFVEVFDHEDPALEQLRHLEPGHGVDTRDGRSYNEVVAAGLGDVARRLNNLVARGILKSN